MTSARSSIGRLHFGFSVGSATVLRYQTIEALFEEKKLSDGTLKIDCSWVVAGRQGFGWGAVLHCFQGADVLRDELGSSGAYFLTIQLTKEYTSSFTINWSECCLAPPQIPKIPVASGSGRAPGTRGQRWILFLKIALLAFRLGAQQATSIPAHAIEQEHAAAPVSPFRIRPKGGCPICGRRPVAAGVDALWFFTLSASPEILPRPGGFPNRAERHSQHRARESSYSPGALEFSAQHFNGKRRRGTLSQTPRSLIYQL